MILVVLLLLFLIGRKGIVDYNLTILIKKNGFKIHLNNFSNELFEYFQG